MIFSAAQYSGIGGRPKNEDACVYDLKRGIFMAAVADGLGGHGSGEIASGAALKVLAEHSDRCFPIDEQKILTLFSEMVYPAVTDMGKDRTLSA
jgi:serine/threonine protein phosphatase PrpC